MDYILLFFKNLRSIVDKLILHFQQIYYYSYSLLLYYLIRLCDNSSIIYNWALNWLRIIKEGMVGYLKQIYDFFYTDNKYKGTCLYILVCIWCLFALLNSIGSYEYFRLTLGKIQSGDPTWISGFILSNFTNTGFWHFYYNMFLFILLASTVERRIGFTKFWVIIIFTSIGANLTSLMVLNPNVAGLGSSAIVYGMMGAYICKPKFNALTIFIIPLLVFKFLYELHLSAFPNPSTNIGHMAHVIGFVCGMVGYLWLDHRSYHKIRKRRSKK